MLKSFIKMHGLGNDFAIFDGRAQKLEIPTEKIRALGDRRTGIGFDQLIIIDAPKSAGADVFMRIFNPDGSEAEACGNATRCVAKLLFDELKKQDVVIETKAAKLKAQSLGDKVRVDMGPANLGWQQIPLSGAMDTLSLPLEEGGFKSPVAVNMGNPHAVFFVDDVMAVPLEKVGPKIEHHPLFPARTNVEFAQILSKTEIRMRVWERSAGITQACGSAACATGVAAVRRGLTERKTTLLLDGGNLEIEWRESDDHVLMTGETAEVYRAEVEL